MKVYSLQATGVNGEPAGINDTFAIDALGGAIAALAAARKEDVWFHAYTGFVAGAPAVLVECSEALFAEIKKIDGVYNAHELSTAPGFGTARHAWLQEHYASVPAPSPATPALSAGDLTAAFGKFAGKTVHIWMNEELNGDAKTGYTSKVYWSPRDESNPLVLEMQQAARELGLTLALRLDEEKPDGSRKDRVNAYLEPGIGGWKISPKFDLG